MVCSPARLSAAGMLASSFRQYQLGIRATLGVRGAAKEREGILVALWHLPPLEAPALGVLPTHALELCHYEDSAPRLNDSLGLLYGYLPRLVAEHTPVDCFHALGLYSPECVEAGFSEYRGCRVLGSSGHYPTVPWAAKIFGPAKPLLLRVAIASPCDRPCSCHNASACG
jgi:hypothetical protein